MTLSTDRGALQPSAKPGRRLPALLSVARLVISGQVAPVVDIGRGDRGMAHRDYDLIKAAYNTASGIEPLHRGTIVVVGEDPAGLGCLAPSAIARSDRSLSPRAE